LAQTVRVLHPGEAKVGIMPGLYLKETGLYLNQELDLRAADQVVKQG
jgi:hypothetical protein